MEIKNRIIQKAAELFMRYGIRSVSMDDIARELGISKKTIYLHFLDKDEIVYQMMQIEVQKDQCEFEELDAISENIIEKMMKTSEMLRVQISSMNPTTIFDIRKYYPRAWTVFQEHKQKFFLESIRKDLKRGIEEGLFRANVHIEILSRMRMEQIELGFDYQVFPPNKFSLLEVQLVFLDHFIRGILTEKGVELYEHYYHEFQPVKIRV